jgi:hypothetical protein
LVLAYLALVRPLEALLCAITGGTEAEQMTMMTTLFASEGARWTAEHYGLALEQAFVQGMNEDIGIREYRQIQAALSGYHLSKWTELFLDTDEAVFEQQGHTTATHDREYDRVIAQSHGVSQHSQLRFELASIQWQAVIFPRSGDESTVNPSESNPVDTSTGVFDHLEEETNALNLQANPKKVPANAISVPLSVLRGLRKILKNNSATYRSEEQARATTLMTLQSDTGSPYQGQDLLVILPTGMGKTLTWLVAGELGDHNLLTIVVVPLNALLLDLESRLSTYGQKVHRQDPRASVQLEGLRGCLLISVDRIVQDDAIKQIHAYEHRIVSQSLMPAGATFILIWH